MSITMDKNDAIKELFKSLLSNVYVSFEKTTTAPDWDGTYWVFKTPSGAVEACVNISQPLAHPISGSRKFKTVGKVANLEDGRRYYPLFTEPCRGSGCWDEFQGFWLDWVSEYLCSRASGVATTTALSGQDWTVERTFELMHTSSNLTGWVDGGQVAQNTTNISSATPRWYFIFEVFNQSGHTYTNEGIAYIKPDSLGRLISWEW